MNIGGADWARTDPLRNPSGIGPANSRKSEEDYPYKLEKYAQHHLTAKRRYGSVTDDYGIMTDRYGVVTGHYGQSSKSVTIERNRRSQPCVMTGHGRPEYPVHSFKCRIHQVTPSARHHPGICNESDLIEFLATSKVKRTGSLILAYKHLNT